MAPAKKARVPLNRIRWEETETEKLTLPDSSTMTETDIGKGVANRVTGWSTLYEMTILLSLSGCSGFWPENDMIVVNELRDNGERAAWSRTIAVWQRTHLSASLFFGLGWVVCFFWFSFSSLVSLRPLTLFCFFFLFSG